MELPAILDANADYRESAFAAAARTPQPARRLVILTCMDARLDLFRALGLEVGDAHILRNAGGRVSDDALRSLVVSSHLLGTREFGVIHHTNCGLEAKTEEEVAAAVASSLGRPAPPMRYLPFGDVERSVVEDVEVIAASGALPGDAVVWGAVYDVDDGTVRVVAEPRGVAAGGA